MLIKLILEARKAKIDIDWLQAQLAVTEIWEKVISGKTVIAESIPYFRSRLYDYNNFYFLQLLYVRMLHR